MFNWINFARAFERLYHFCVSDDPDAVRGRAECEAQYEQTVHKPFMDGLNNNINAGIPAPKPILRPVFRVLLYALIIYFCIRGLL